MKYWKLTIEHVDEAAGVRYQKREIISETELRSTLYGPARFIARAAVDMYKEISERLNDA